MYIIISGRAADKHITSDNKNKIRKKQYLLYCNAAIGLSEADFCRRYNG